MLEIASRPDEFFHPAHEQESGGMVMEHDENGSWDGNIGGREIGLQSTIIP